MKFSFSDGFAGNLVRSYEPGLLRINDRIYDHSLVITATSLRRWEVADAALLTAADLRVLLTEEPEVVVLGTGERQRFPPRAVRHALLDAGVGLEIMSTAAAARTYNVLVAEDRRVVAALIL